MVLFCGYFYAARTFLVEAFLSYASDVNSIAFSKVVWIFELD